MLAVENMNTGNIGADVIVAGAGPTGLLLANLLGTMGVKTLILERNAETVREPRAVSIDDESMRAMQAAGVADDVERITARGYGSIYRGPSREVFATVKPFLREYGFDKRNAFQQPELEALLRGKLARFECVSAHFSAELTDFEQRGDRVVASVRPAGGAPYRVESKYLVACDGGRSGIRKALGVEMHGSTFEEPWLIVDLKHTRNRCFHTEVFCDPARPCITLPGPDGIRRYEFMLHKHEDREAAAEEGFVRRLLSQVGPDGDEELRRVQVYTFHARTADRWRHGRVFLAGDAAHLTPPFAGQGMNSGLRDAHNLAWKLAEALKVRDAERLLDSYESERKPHAWSMIMLALRMGQVMTPTSHLQGALVRGGFRALGIVPPARDYFAQMRYKPKPRFKRGLIWSDGRPASRTIVGQMIPQPVVETATRTRVLLDSILPDGLVLLVYSERPETALSEAARERFAAAGVAVVGLTPEWFNPIEAGFPIVRDASGFFARAPYAGYLEHALLLRRDRYVASTRTIAAVDELAPLIGELSPAAVPPVEVSASEAGVAAARDQPPSTIPVPGRS
jgi:3-(3-hydroxy-phenyl)propionate hydroxylase